MRHIVIGDIHGCHAELLDLLDAVSPSADDRIVANGDIVDRGPDSERALRFFREHSNAMSILGNHERKHLRSARGETRAALSQRIVRHQLGGRYEVGHHSYLANGEPVVRDGRVYAIDTGCCHGGRLTALILPGFRIVSVPARRDYWSEQKLGYSALRDSRRPAMDLDWARVAAYARAARLPDLPAPVTVAAHEFARRLAQWEALETAVLDAVSSEHERIVERLRGAGDWDQCSDRTRAARYAKIVADRKAAPLLFAAWRGRLDQETLRRFCRTPRELVAFARACLCVSGPIRIRAPIARKGERS